MLKLTLLILDEDTEFSDYLQNFISTSSYHHKFHVKHFTSFDLLTQEITNDNTHDLLLASHQFENSWRDYGSNSQVIWLTDTEVVEETNLADELKIYRFQSFEKICSALVTISQTLHGKHHTDYRKTQIISFFSTVGHCGKTLFALSLAKQLAWRGKKVFYLNLEDMSSLSTLMNWQTNHNFSNFIYYMRNAPQNIGIHLEKLRSRDPHSGIDYISPGVDIRDLQQLQKEDIQSFLKHIVEMESYDYIFIDLSSSIYSWVTHSLSLSHHIFWLLLDDLNCFSKTNGFQKRISTQANIHFVVNKFTGNLYNDYKSTGIHLAGYLPYIPEWKSVQQAKDYFNHLSFDQQAYRAFQKCVHQDFAHEGG